MIRTATRNRTLYRVAAITLWLAPAQAAAHNLPISRLTLVADDDYLHAEIVLNAEELTFLVAWDEDRDGRLAPAELAAHGDAAAASVFGRLRLKASGRTAVPQSCGLVPGGDGHHLVFRAHYAGDFTRAPLIVESRLTTLTRGAHSTQVVFQAPGMRETAVLDARSVRATFNAAVAASEQTAVASAALISERTGPLWRRIGGAWWIIAAIGGFLLIGRTQHRRHAS
ncbi:MAG: hypothetical protein KF688_19555 [Pirellulales bacterium]|nr:hypothetical protein [Pirellulales bacterium]